MREQLEAKKMRAMKAGMRIQIRSDPLIIGPPEPDPVLFSLDPDPGPTCNNGFIKLFSSWTKYNLESTNSNLKRWLKRSNLMPTYLRYRYIFFIHFDIRSDTES